MNSNSTTEIPTTADETNIVRTKVKKKNKIPTTLSHCHVRSLEIRAIKEIVRKKLIATTHKNKIG